MTEFATRTAHENLPGTVIHLLETRRGHGEAPRLAKAASTALDAVKAAGLVDDIRGLELYLDDVAHALGEVLLAEQTR